MSWITPGTFGGRRWARPAVGEVGDWLGTATVEFRELLLGSLLEPDTPGL